MLTAIIISNIEIPQTCLLLFVAWWRLLVMKNSGSLARSRCSVVVVVFCSVPERERHSKCWAKEEETTDIDLVFMTINSTSTRKRVWLSQQNFIQQGIKKILTNNLRTAWILPTILPSVPDKASQWLTWRCCVFALQRFPKKNPSIQKKLLERERDVAKKLVEHHTRGNIMPCAWLNACSWKTKKSGRWATR